MLALIRIDKDGRGYSTIHEWGKPEVWPHMSEFARLYIQKTRGADGRYKEAKMVRFYIEAKAVQIRGLLEGFKLTILILLLFFLLRSDCVHVHSKK